MITYQCKVHVELGFEGVYIIFALEHRLWVLVRTFFMLNSAEHEI